jgi:hypothetical protein
MSAESLISISVYQGSSVVKAWSKIVANTNHPGERSNEVCLSPVGKYVRREKARYFSCNI